MCTFKIAECIKLTELLKDCTKISKCSNEHKYIKDIECMIYILKKIAQSKVENKKLNLTPPKKYLGELSLLAGKMGSWTGKGRDDHYSIDDAK